MTKYAVLGGNGAPCTAPLPRVAGLSARGSCHSGVTACSGALWSPGQRLPCQPGLSHPDHHLVLQVYLLLLLNSFPPLGSDGPNRARLSSASGPLHRLPASHFHPTDSVLTKLFWKASWNPPFSVPQHLCIPQCPALDPLSLYCKGPRQLLVT